METRRLRQQSTVERELETTSAATNNNRKKGSIYALENLRLAMLMKDTKLRQRVKKKKGRPRIVHDMLTLERRYAETARKLQKWWRGHLLRQFWRLHFRQVKAVVQIQRVARGYLTRRWVCIWHANRTIRVTRLQALFRGYYIRYKVIPTWKRWENLNAVKIQSIIRMYFAKECCRRYKEEIAALHIQILWRGYYSRKWSDILWLDAKATNLQRLVRGTLARKHTRRRVVRLQSSAIQIQRMFRGMKARMEINIVLRDRETVNRKEFMAMLDAEEEWHRAQRDKLQARLNRKQLRQRVAQLEYDYYTKHEEIHDMESIYLDMQTQRMRVSPRAIEHGWVEEMEAKMKQQRALITKLKLETVFGLGLEFKQKEKELIECRQLINEIEEKRRRLEIWRNEEFLDYWERECRFRYQAKLIQKRQQVAENRRRWQVQFYHTSGKRDNRWRGTYWSQEVLEAAKEKEIFCIGSTDILALVQDKWRLRMQEIGQVLIDEEKERGTREHISDLTDQVALTAATAQIEQTMALFDPVFRDVEHSFDTVLMQQRRRDRYLVAVRQERKTIPGAARKSITDEDPKAFHRRVEDPARELAIQQRKRQLVLAAKVPWHLLDQLEAERRKLAHEKAMFKLWGKTYSRESGE
ncbi:IQGAP protein [Phytophthora palmivora]|uniref:IQGAP protein n=1 Tax=Phytophthora palmivora TaxID=4796 RepID=A0A2P4XVI8_9STRA|nr:IQGAP protein [Phytophthora palmivora]